MAQVFLPAGVYNPVVTADGQRWRDFELEAQGSVVVAAPREPERGQWRPLRLERCRPYGVAGGLARPDPQTQEDMVRAVPVTEQGIPRRFPDPRGMWIRLINGAGAAEDPFRATNAVDCALAVLCTWYGAPTVAAPRRPEYDRVGKPLLTGEAGGVARAERWLGQRFQYVGQGRHAYLPIAQALLAGHRPAGPRTALTPGPRRPPEDRACRPDRLRPAPPPEVATTGRTGLRKIRLQPGRSPGRSRPRAGRGPGDPATARTGPGPR